MEPLFLPPANEVWGKVIFSEVCVKNSVHRGVCLSACWDTTPWDQAPLLGSGTPPRTRHPRHQALPGTRHPLKQSMLGDTVNEWAVCIRLECNLVCKNFKSAACPLGDKEIWCSTIKARDCYTEHNAKTCCQTCSRFAQPHLPESESIHKNSYNNYKFLPSAQSYFT